MHVAANHAVILRARRKRLAWGETGRRLYTRHRWQVEGTHGTAKMLHGPGRAIRRGLENVNVQALLTAVAMNLKKLAATVRFVLSLIPGLHQRNRETTCG